MSTQLTMFNQGQLPAHVAAFFEQEQNIVERQTVPSLTYEGKVWTISKDGTKTKMLKMNEDSGAEEPVATIKVVVLDYHKTRGRAYYEGAYDPAKPGMPVCWSTGGEAPDKEVTAPQSAKCKTCPQSAKGSKVTEQGKAVTACSMHRMIAVVPASQPSFTPLRCKLAITSLFDKQSPELDATGWYAFEQYVDYLRANNIHHTAAVVTKMRFDPSVAYPKVIFSPERFLEPAELAVIGPVVKSEEVAALLDGTFTPNGVDGKPAADLGFDTPEPEAPAAAPVPQATVTPIKATAKPDISQPAPQPAAAPAPAAATPNVPKEVADLLKDWAS